MRYYNDHLIYSRVQDEAESSAKIELYNLKGELIDKFTPEGLSAEEMVNRVINADMKLGNDIKEEKTNINGTSNS